MDPIVAALLILFFSGFIVGQSYLAIRHKEPPKKEPQHQVLMQRDLDHGKVTGTFPEGRQDGQENLPQDQQRKDPRQ